MKPSLAKIKSLIIVSSFVVLGSLNILTLINEEAHRTGFNLLKSILSPVLSDVAMSNLFKQSLSQRYSALEKSYKKIEVNHAELKKVTAVRSQVVKNMSVRISRRAVANATKNVSSFTPQIAPGIGVAAIVALTVSDLYDDCQTLKDLNELNVSFDLEKEDESTVCGIKF